MTKVSLAGKVAIVTGGGRGLGRAMGIGFAQAGAAGIAVTSAASPQETASVVREIEAILGARRAIGFQADVSNWTDCERVVAETVKTFGCLHILVNNAGKAGYAAGNERRPFWDATPEGWRRVVDTNVTGPFYMAKAAVPHLLKEKKSGRIINISKNRSSMFRPTAAPYGPTKAALEAMTLAFAADLLAMGITVNSLSPGGSSDTGLSSPEARAKRRDEVGLLDPMAMAPPAVWLASDLSEGVTGCRFIAKKWDASLPPTEAAEKARDIPIFVPVRNKGGLDKAWDNAG
jgi:NAD(P)-dependent dehydrogenase (short-subunit alcohol dehydrogenase family)